MPSNAWPSTSRQIEPRRPDADRRRQGGPPPLRLANEGCCGTMQPNRLTRRRYIRVRYRWHRAPATTEPARARCQSRWGKRATRRATAAAAGRAAARARPGTPAPAARPPAPRNSRSTAQRRRRRDERRAGGLVRRPAPRWQRRRSSRARRRGQGDRPRSFNARVQKSAAHARFRQVLGMLGTRIRSRREVQNPRLSDRAGLAGPPA